MLTGGNNENVFMGKLGYAIATFLEINLYASFSDRYDKERNLTFTSVYENFWKQRS